MVVTIITCQPSVARNSYHTILYSYHTIAYLYHTIVTWNHRNIGTLYTSFAHSSYQTIVYIFILNSPVVPTTPYYTPYDTAAFGPKDTVPFMLYLQTIPSATLLHQNYLQHNQPHQNIQQHCLQYN